MTEQEWLLASTPKSLLPPAQKSISDRKLRLFAIACCRRIIDRLSQKERDALDVLEQYADGVVDNSERRRVAKDIKHSTNGAVSFCSSVSMSQEFEHLGGSIAWIVSDGVAKAVARQLLPKNRTPYQDSQVISEIIASSEWRNAIQGEQRDQTRLLRDIVENPFSTCALGPRNNIITSLAKDIYRTKRFDRMPDLGRALEHDGCRDFLVLDHCERQNHVRGCWVIDRLLGKT